MRNISDDILLQMFSLTGVANDLWTPKADIYETADDIIVKLCASGLDPQKLELNVSSDNKLLVVRGMRVEFDEDQEDRIRYYQLELYYGEFERVVTLPRDIIIDKDALSATYKNGFLKIKLPKKKQPKKRLVVDKE